MMYKTRWPLAGFLLTAAALVIGCDQATKYDQNQFNDDAAVRKQAGTYWGKNGFWSLPKESRKIVITEFSVEYVTANVSKSGADALSVLGAMEMAGMGRRERAFPETFMQDFPTTLYTNYVSALEAEGFEVVPMQKVAEHPAFKDLQGAGTGSGGSANAAGFLGHSNPNEQKKFKVYPVKGLNEVDDQWFRGMSNNPAEAKITGELGAQINMRVRMRVALDDDGHAILDNGSTIRILYNFTSGPKFGGGTQWGAGGSGVINSKTPMRDDVPVVTKKEFQAFHGDVYQVDATLYQESIMKMYPAYAKMASIIIKN